jgi:hypothetical protein
MGRFNMHKVALTYYDRVDAYMAENLDICLSCPNCRIEREKGEAWGSRFTHTYYECDVLDGLARECPQLEEIEDV